MDNFHARHPPHSENVAVPSNLLFPKEAHQRNEVQRKRLAEMKEVHRTIVHIHFLNYAIHHQYDVAHPALRIQAWV